MELALSQRQLSFLIKQSVNQRLKIYEQDASSDPTAAQPTAGTSSKQGGGQGYPEVGKWESGIERGADNQISVTKWSDVVGSKLTRGHANPLKEQGVTLTSPSLSRQSTSNFQPTTSVNSGISGQLTVKQKNDGNLIVDLSKNSISDAISDVRHFFYETLLGMATEVAFVLATDGVGEIGVIGMNFIILINDTYIFNKNYGNDANHKPIPQGSSVWESIEFLYNQNQEFSNIMVDILVCATGGVFSAVRTMSKAGKLSKLKSLFSGGVLESMIKWLKSIFTKISSLMSKLAKPLYEKISTLIPGLTKFVEYLEGLLAGQGGRVAQKAVTIPLTIGKTYIALLAIEAGIGTTKLLGRAFKWTANEINLALNGKSTPEMVEKVDAVMTSADKQNLQASQGKVVKEAYTSVIKGGETTRKLTYQVMIDMKLINCSYNEFNVIPDSKHDLIYVIKNVKYYVTPDSKLIKIK
jgi:hypothetical protein